MSKTKKLPGIQNPDHLDWINRYHEDAAHRVQVLFPHIRRLRYRLLNEPYIRQLFESFPEVSKHGFFTSKYNAESLLRSFDFALLGERETLKQRDRQIGDRAYDLNIPRVSVRRAFQTIEKIAEEASGRVVQAVDNSRDAPAFAR